MSLLGPKAFIMRAPNFDVNFQVLAVDFFVALRNPDSGDWYVTSFTIPLTDLDNALTVQAKAVAAAITFSGCPNLNVVFL